MKKRSLLLGLVLILGFAFAVLGFGSTKAASSAATEEVSYTNDVQPILESRCGTCHMGEFVSEGLHMDTYESLMAGSDSGLVILPGNADKSLLVQQLVKGKMPKRGPKLTPAQIQTITDWIDAGAPNN